VIAQIALPVVYFYVHTVAPCGQRNSSSSMVVGSTLLVVRSKELLGRVSKAVKENDVGRSAKSELTTCSIRTFAYLLTS
jgi:hypothetical protein